MGNEALEAEDGRAGESAWAWRSDRALWAILAFGLLLRLTPMILWPQFECLRDECIYRSMAYEIMAGKGLTVSNKGWLPAPGYPFLLAWLKQLTGFMYAVKWVQIGLSMVSIVCLYISSFIAFDKRTARIAAALFAVNPTMAWFTNTMWIETIYIFFLLLAIVMMQRSRVTDWSWSVGSGISLGMAVLFRGVATYLPPFFVLAAIYPENPFSMASWWGSAKRRWRHVLGFALGAVLTVSPYSMTASQKYGGFLVTDATVGHVLFLGNNDFPPLTFDYGNGMLTQPLFAKYLRTGRRPCRRDRPPVQSSRCEVQETKNWIMENPDKFAGRVPLRLAQMLNPNSFLTRHIRWGYWPGLPWWMKEGLALTIVGFSLSLTTFGTVGAWARAKGPLAMMAVGTTVYTFATIAVMYGMTRFRLPLEALWTVYLAAFLANPKLSYEALKQSSWRTAGVLLTLPALIALSMWFLPTGFPMFW